MADKTILKLTKTLDFLKRRLSRLMIVSGPDKRGFCRFQNEISLIISDFDKRAEELGQYYTEKEVNPEEIDQRRQKAIDIKIEKY